MNDYGALKNFLVRAVTCYLFRHWRCYLHIIMVRVLIGLAELAVRSEPIRDKMAIYFPTCVFLCSPAARCFCLTVLDYKSPIVTELRPFLIYTFTYIKTF